MIGSTLVQKLSPGFRDTQKFLDGVFGRVFRPKQRLGMTIHQKTGSGTLDVAKITSGVVPGRNSALATFVYVDCLAPIPFS